MAQVVERLPNKRESWSSSINTAKKHKFPIEGKVSDWCDWGPYSFLGQEKTRYLL
jgi:hypothetical protein